jgi:predicted HAD superfamily Cof-like phosphohydrolase
MKDKIDKVKLFHEVFLIGNEDKLKTDVEKSTFQLRYDLMKEENEEYLEACKNGDVVEIADALGDMLYIWCGSVLKHGMQDVIEEIFNEIQRSNMSKLDVNGKPIFREDGKVLKGENYFKPNLKAIIEKHVGNIDK